MKNRSLSTFKYNFRAAGSQVEGPIRFATGHTTTGMVLIGRTPHGVCAILLGDDAQDLHRQLAEAFPGVELQADQRALQRELNQIIAFVDRGTSDEVINLDVGGTDFEQMVWRELCDILEGQVRSYSDVALALGMPDAARAVAHACASNVLAIAIPCHRVVRSDGSVAGYRWGVERKLALLNEERDG